jgi:hypothetical protein
MNMNEPRWYVIGKYGEAYPCASKQNAEWRRSISDEEYPSSAPHRAVQLVDAAELEAAQKRIAELEAELEQAKIECTNAINN